MTSALYELVVAYASLGDHRTGTVVDEATIGWFADQARVRGAEVEIRPFSFDRYAATWEVSDGSGVVKSIPLYYRGVGSFATDAPRSMEIDAFALFLSAPEPSADVCVCATTGVDGRLVVPNRRPELEDAAPVLLVPGDAAGRRLRVELDAEIVPGTSANVIARFGDGDGDPLIIATPLSGWFACAGERGTGIAVALEVARAVGARHPVLLVGTSGHELHDLGLHRLLETWTPAPRAIVHVGASLAAAASPQGDFSTTRPARISVPPDVSADIEDALRAIQLTPAAVAPDVRNDPGSWIGEAQEWCRFDALLVSVTGYFPLFHTPDDVPDAATTPALLERAHDAISRVAERLTTMR